MNILAILLGLLILIIVLGDTFETIVLPRTVTRRLRLTGLFYRAASASLRTIMRLLPPGSRREGLLFAYGPMSLLLLIALWAGCLIIAFALIQWGMDVPFHGAAPHASFGTFVYFSGVTFFTLGFGDVTPATPLGRTVAVCEAGVGFGFLAVVISYLPVLYQSFSRREVTISMLDARAGSPPSAGELLRRLAAGQAMQTLEGLLREWEQWSAELLESYLSYPILSFYRSQHDGESWLSALTAILDACALVRVGCQGGQPWQNTLRRQAQLTFAMARHAVVDLALILNVPPVPMTQERLSEEDFARLEEILTAADLPLCDRKATQAQLAELRRQYEPYVNELARRLFLALPPWVSPADAADNWQTSAWENSSHL